MRRVTAGYSSVTGCRNTWEARGAWFPVLGVTVLRLLLIKLKRYNITKRGSYRLKTELY